MKQESIGNVMTEQQIRVAGKGVAELPVPAWLKFARIWMSCALFAAVASGGFFAGGWRWVTDATADGVSVGFAIWSAVVMTLAVATPLAFAKLGWLNATFNIRRSSDGEPVFGGFRSAAGPLWVLLALAAPTAAASYFVYASIASCPLPDRLARIRIESPSPEARGRLMPLYLWDYATFIDPEWFDHVDLVLPYEKGPPQKLFPKVYFEDSRTHLILLELHGKRPRSYDPREIFDIFSVPATQPRDWPLIWRLEREAGLTAEGLSPPTLFLMTLAQSTTSEVTHAIGVPWRSSERLENGHSVADPSEGRLFFWGPDGSVFQVKCASPCAMAPMLELTQFPKDPAGSRAKRLDWTKERLKELLTATEGPAGNSSEKAASPAHTRQENLLSLYLVSLLTLDPRDPEVYFHIGKLARNLTTVRAAISYGRDVGLEHAKIVELEGVADRLSP